jgi:4-amino-4-deoxy-L-arabinose transferase-like glycosyltransferase
MRALAVKIFHSTACMVGLGLLARILYLVIFRCYIFQRSHWFEFESCEIAYSLVNGRGYTLVAGGGPSAWLAPIYPWTIAIFFLLFGALSHAAAFAVLAFNSLVAALTSWTTYQIARKVFSQSVAVWSGWIWALWPPSVYYSVYWLWDTALSTFLLSLVLLLTLAMRDDSRILRWCVYGLLWGVIGLTNPSLLVWLPFSGCWLAWQLHRSGKRYLTPVLVSSLAFFVTLSPWLVRNYMVFDNPILLRNGFGPNLRGGNNPDAQGWWVVDYSYNNPSLLEQYRKLGELASCNEQARLAREWILAHRARFANLCLRRFVIFWIGNPGFGLASVGISVLGIAAMRTVLILMAWGGLWFAIKRHVRGAFLFATLLASYPLMYYITFPQSRYRHPIEPELLILIVFCAATGVAQLQRTRRARGISESAERPSAIPNSATR